MLSLRNICLGSLIFGVIAFSTFVVITDSGPRIKNGPRITSYAHLSRIGVAIRDYAEANGDRPQALSSLVPRHIPIDRIGIFYVTNSYAKNPTMPSDWLSNPARIDQHGAYVYLGTAGANGVLAYEKTDLWNSNAPHSGKLAVLFTDYHVQYLPALKLSELIGAKGALQKPPSQ